MTAPGIDLEAAARRDADAVGEATEADGTSTGKPGRLRRWLIILGCTLLILAGLGYAGYRYLLTTEWGVFFTLFADDERAENFRTMDEIFPSRDIAAGASVRELDRDERDLPASYDFEGESHALDDFLDRTETTGLVVLHHGTPVHEQYRQGYDAESRATSWSMAKSMVSVPWGSVSRCSTTTPHWSVPVSQAPSTTTSAPTRACSPPS